MTSIKTPTRRTSKPRHDPRPNVPASIIAKPEDMALQRMNKTALVLDLLSRGERATLDQLVAATGWQPHTTRAALGRQHGAPRSEGDARRCRCRPCRCHRRLQGRSPDPKPALGINDKGCLSWSMPLSARRPFREAKLRINPKTSVASHDQTLMALLTYAAAVQRMVLASPKMSMNQIANREGWCRTQLTKLLCLSWLSPRIV